MKVLHVIADLERQRGGTSAVVPRLCASLAALGVEIELLFTGPNHAETMSGSVPPYRCRQFPNELAQIPLLRQLCMSSRLSHTIRSSSSDAELIHNHGLWLLPNVYAGRSASAAHRSLVVSPHGMLSESALSFSRVKKELFWRATQRSALAGAACYQATAESELRDIRAFGIRAPVALIPNGVDVPSLRSRGSLPIVKTLLFIGRLHPIKALPKLLRAWSLVEGDLQDWRLRIVGPDEREHGRELRAEAKRLGLRSVSIEPPVYGEEKEMLLNKATIFILPSESENFGLAAAEALAAGCPVIAARGTPWSGLVTERCGWWINNDPATIARAIREAAAMPEEELSAMGVRGRSWAEREFSWEAVTESVMLLYDWLLGRGVRPQFVHSD